MSTIVMRKAVGRDLEAITACADLAFASIFRTVGKTIAEPNGELAKQIRQGSIHLIYGGAKMLGYISFSSIADHVFVSAVAVLPKYRGLGLGSRLLDAAENEALRLGLSSVKLFTDMSANIAFYRRRGYRETGRCEENDFARVYYSKDIVLVLDLRRHKDSTK